MNTFQIRSERSFRSGLSINNIFKNIREDKELISYPPTHEFFIITNNNVKLKVLFAKMVNVRKNAKQMLIVCKLKAGVKMDFAFGGEDTMLVI